jgi:thiol-disulfide isomerase/thioredoxin
MKHKAFVLVILIISVILIALLTHKQADIPDTRQPVIAAPDIKLIDISKNTLRLSELRGSVVFVNFWASWCEPCIEEIPSIEKLYRNLSGNTQFKMITVLFRDDEKRIVQYLKERGYTFPVYLDPDNSGARQFGITGVPETFIIDKKGFLREKVIGPAEWDSEQAVNLLTKLLNE